MNTIDITASCGTLRGNKKEGYYEFLGVRYATAERFCMPQKAKAFEGVYDATYFKDCCPQYRAYHDESVKKDTLWYDEFRKGLSFTYSEDCLNLNIYAPEQGNDCPVLLYIHGGSFVKGSSNEKAFDGREYARRGIILVTINYRLNVFGFFADDKVNNLALYDMLSALDWIKENISAFGGNPDKVTLFGQSAGAMCTQDLLLSKKTEGKIKGAVMLSGGGLAKGLYAPHNKAYAKRFTNIVKKEGGEGLSTMPEAELFAVWEKVSSKHPILSLIANMPVFDGNLLCKKDFKALKKTALVPAVIGTTKDDIQPRSYLYKGATRYAKLSLASVWLYRFNRNLPGDDRGAWHSCDLWYAFGSLDKGRRPFEDKDYAISKQMIDAIAGFAEDGKMPADWPLRNIKELV